MDTLVSIGSSSAWLWSTVVLVADIDADVYFETGAVIVALILLGKWLEARAKRRSGDAIRALAGLGAKTTQLEDGTEIPVTDLDRAREFFSQLFGWEFQEWGPDYYSFNDGRLDGGLRRSEEPAPASGVLIVFYTQDIDRDYARVQELGATISQETLE